MNLVEAHSTCSLSLLFWGFVQNLCVWFHSITYTCFPLLLTFAEKSMLNTAVSQFCSGFTEVVSTFLEKVSEDEAPASQRVAVPSVQRQIILKVNLPLHRDTAD